MFKKLRNSLFSSHAKWVREEKKVLHFLLYFLSLFFYAGVKIKNFFFDKRIFSFKKAPFPVISIGNIIAGGSGKTPITQLLIQELSKKKLKVGVATRGYRAEKKQKNILGCKGNGPLFSSKVVGDEPYLLAKTSPSIYLAVGKKRANSCEMLAKEGVAVTLLDDGMQHRKLYRDIEIVLLHGEKLFGRNHYLPRGELREDPKRLAAADLILVNHSKDFTRIKSIVKLYSKKPICFIRPKLKGIYSLDERKKIFIKNKNIGVFCSIAYPESFIRILREAGAKIVKTLYGLDHEEFCESQLHRFAAECKKAGVEHILCTEKDQVKIRKCFKTQLSIGFVKMEIEFLQGKDHWDSLIEKVVNLIQRNVHTKEECI